VLLCPVPAGSILIYMPLLFHSSGPNTRQVSNEHRRVIHTEYRPRDSSPGNSCQWYPWRHGAEIFADHIRFREDGG
jgi:hypothetical protein